MSSRAGVERSATLPEARLGRLNPSAGRSSSTSASLRQGLEESGVLLTSGKVERWFELLERSEHFSERA